MKKKAILTTVCLINIFMLAGYVHAQQTQVIKPEDLNAQIQLLTKNPDFSYHIFQAPNKMYGYDIFKNGKIVFHQGASSIPSNKFLSVLSKKEHADKAALRSIEKMKKNEPATLTQEEIRKISAK